MKKTILLLLIISLLLSCDPNRSPKFIDEKTFDVMREQCKQKVGSSYSFDCVVGLHTTPYTYRFYIENNNGIIKKTWSLIHSENVESLTDEQINEKLLKRKNELGDVYEESYEKVCIEDVNTIDDVFLLVSTIYQNELKKYQQNPSSSYFVSKIEYDEIYSFSKDFYLLTTKPRPMIVGGDMGINVWIKNFQQNID